MLIAWRNGVSKSAGNGVWLMDSRWDRSFAKADGFDYEPRLRMNQPTPECTQWFRHQKFVGTCWGKCGTCWGSTLFGENYLHITDVAISNTSHYDMWCRKLTVSEYCFGAVRQCWRYQRCCHRNSGIKRSQWGRIRWYQGQKGCFAEKNIGHLHF